MSDNVFAFFTAGSLLSYLSDMHVALSTNGNTLTITPIRPQDITPTLREQIHLHQPVIIRALQLSRGKDIRLNHLLQAQTEIERWSAKF